MYHNKVSINIRRFDESLLKCHLCDFECNLNIKLKHHIKRKHVISKYNCGECSFGSDLAANLWEHTNNTHTNLTEKENLFVKLIAEQNIDLLEEIEQLKKDTKNAFLELAKSIDSCFGLMKDEINSKLEKQNEMIESLINKTTLNSSIQANSVQTNNITGIDVYENVEKKKTKISLFNSKPKILVVKDSVGNAMSARIVEKASNCRVKTVDAAANLTPPSRPLKDIVHHELKNPGRDPIEYLVLSAPTDDINKLDTAHVSLGDNIDTYVEEAKKSSQNIVNLAESSLEQYSSLKKVVLMDHPSRFDTHSNDPSELKPYLARLANSEMKKQVETSIFKDKICIGNHSLSQPRKELFESRFVDHTRRIFDGVHMFGPSGHRDYTRSVTRIFRQAGLYFTNEMIEDRCKTLNQGNF